MSSPIEMHCFTLYIPTHAWLILSFKSKKVKSGDFFFGDNLL